MSCCLEKSENTINTIDIIAHVHPPLPFYPLTPQLYPYYNLFERKEIPWVLRSSSTYKLFSVVRSLRAFIGLLFYQHEAIDRSIDQHETSGMKIWMSIDQHKTLGMKIWLSINTRQENARPTRCWEGYELQCGNVLGEMSYVEATQQVVVTH